MSVTIEEKAAIQGLLARLDFLRPKNEIKERYYEAKNKLRNIGLRTLPDLKFSASIGWAGTAVDILNSRVKLTGFVGAEDIDLNDIVAANSLIEEASMIHLDAFIYGIAFMMIGKGDTEIGEPSIITTIESPNNIAFNRDVRTRRITDAIHAIYDENGEVKYVTYFTTAGNVTVKVYKSSDGDGNETVMYIEEDRDENELGFIPIVPFVNRERASDRQGRSEITSTIRYCVDAAQRTMYDMEVNRENYSYPQKWASGIDKATASGSGWNNNPTSMIAAGFSEMVDEDGNTTYIKPDFGQFTVNSPAAFIEMLKEYTRMVSAETSIPESYFGVNTANPSSEGAIRMEESPLIAKAEAKAETFATSWKQVLRYSLMLRDGSLPEGFDNISVQFADPATLTKNAETDRILKLIAAGIVQPDSDAVYKILGFNEAQKAQIRKENKAAQSNGLVASLQTLAAQQKPVMTSEAANLANMSGSNVDELTA